MTETSDPRGKTARLDTYAPLREPGPILHPTDYADLAAHAAANDLSYNEFHELQDRPTQKWNLDELDQMHAYAGIGPEWQASARRAELAATIGRRADRLEALAYECWRRTEVLRRAAIIRRLS